MLNAPRRRIALHTSPCATPAVATDSLTGVYECNSTPTTYAASKSRVGVAEFRIDLGRIGQGTAGIDSYNVALEVADTRAGVLVTSLVADPQVADVDAVEEDAGLYRDAQSGLDWAKGVIAAFNASREDLSSAPEFPNDDVFSTLSVANARFAPPRLVPSARRSTKRVVQVWRSLLPQLETRPRLLAVLAEHFLRSGGTAIVAYVSPEAAAPLSAHPAVRALVARGAFLMVRWEGVDQPHGWKDYDQLVVNAHAMLSLWGRNALVMITEAEEIVSLPAHEPELLPIKGVDSPPKSLISAFPLAPRLQPCPAQTGGFWGSVGASSLAALGYQRRWPCTPSEGLAQPTPRQERLARVLAAGGCMHKQAAQHVSHMGIIRQALLQPPRCAQIAGFPMFLLGSSSEKPVGIDGERIEETGSIADAFSDHWREETTVHRRRPFFDPDAVLPPNVHFASECLGRRTQRWGPSPPGGLGAPKPLEKLPDGTWNLASVNASQSPPIKSKDRPVIESACRLVGPCQDAPDDCLQLRRLVNLYGVSPGTRETSQWRKAHGDWLWVWTDGWQSAVAKKARGGKVR